MGLLTKSKRTARVIALVSVFVGLAALGAYLPATGVHHDAPAATAPFPNDNATKTDHNRQRRKANLDRLRSMVDGLKKAALQPEVSAKIPKQSDEIYRRLSRLPTLPLRDSEGETDRPTDRSDDPVRDVPKRRTVEDGLERLGNAENRARIREILEKHAPSEATTSKDTD